MIRLSATKRLLLVASVFLLLVPLAACAVTTPEIHAKIVDAETGEPQEWIRATVYAGKKVLLLAEGTTEKTLFSKSIYFHAKDGEIVIPAQHFTILDFVRYKDWKLVMKCPGHKQLVLEGKAVKRLLKTHAGKTLEIKVAPYQSGLDWEAGKNQWWSNSFATREENESPSSPEIYERGLIREYSWLIANWPRIIPQKHGTSAFMKEIGPHFYVRKYLLLISAFCETVPRDKREQCDAAKSEARHLLEGLPSDLKVQAKLDGLYTKYPWLTGGNND